MKRFKWMAAVYMMVTAMIFIAVNLYMTADSYRDDARPYRVEINRLARQIEKQGMEHIDLSEYDCVQHIEKLKDDDASKMPASFFQGADLDYAIRQIDGVYYRFDYQASQGEWLGRINMTVNIAMATMASVAFFTLLYIWRKILKPFHVISNMPYELSKGNLTVGIKEEKNRFFGHFLWGLDLLRENLEEQKEKELKLQKEKKTLVLSISHDIKTPLSAIKLYAKALERNLYNSEEKRAEIVKQMNGKADEIEGYVSDIITASKEEFLNLEVREGEFYLSELVERILQYYHDKLLYLNIPFEVASYDNCLLKGDIDRAEEAIQNVMENAIKYGDGNGIFFSVAAEEDCRLISIQNTGNSLSKGELPHIFESFWRGSNVKQQSGSGLGLYICRQLMRKMGGDIFAVCDEDMMTVTMVFRRA